MPIPRRSSGSLLRQVAVEARGLALAWVSRRGAMCSQERDLAPGRGPAARPELGGSLGVLGP